MISKNKRKPVLKLMVTGTEPVQQLEYVARDIYDFDTNFIGAIEDNDKWPIVDGIFGKSKEAYDGITRPFLKPPDVFKLEPASKDRALQMDENQSNIELHGTNNSVIEEDELKKFIDPFKIPQCWQMKKDFKGELWYVNSETGVRRREPPQPVIVRYYNVFSHLKRILK